MGAAGSPAIPVSAAENDRGPGSSRWGSPWPAIMASLASGLLAVRIERSGLVVVRVVRGFLRALVGLVGYLGLVGLGGRLVAFVLVVLGVFRLGLRGLDLGLRALR